MEPEYPKEYKPQSVKWYRSDSHVVHLVDFPIYYIECISERHFIVAGGGGSSKTGVHNQINLLEIVPTFNCNGTGCVANLVMKYNTPDEIPDAIMTGSLMKNMPIVDARVITGGSRPAIYSIGFDATKRCFYVAGHEMLNDEKHSPLGEIKTVRSIPGKALTGGVDGQLTIWELDGRGQKRIQGLTMAHKKEIDEIDVDLDGGKIVTLSRDENRCCIWNLDNLELIKDFKRDLIDTEVQSSKTKYSYRSCKYACSKPDNKKQDSFLLIACNPIPKTGFSKILKWNTKNYDKFTTKLTSVDGIMAMTVDLDGKYVGVGTRSGSVLVYEVKNFNRIYELDEAHHNAVTNLEFLHPKPESFNLTNSYTCPLLSVSIDRRIIVHRPRKRRSLLKIFLIFACMLFVKWLIFLFMRNSFYQE